ncbi:MAG TPA: VOC family protein [Nocardioidaceae bacterium]|nr:VOC family protein [Nocardioidaceae bacterium]
MIQVAKLGHSALQVRDLDAAVAYYRDVLGLSVSEQDSDSAQLTTGLDYATILLSKGPQDRILHNAFQLNPDSDLTAVSSQLKDNGVTAELRTDSDPAIPQLLEFEDISGNRIQLYTRTQPAAPAAPHVGVLPHKLGHVCLLTDDVSGLVNFYSDILGFRWSDWMGDFFAFIRCGSDHHTMNFMRGKTREDQGRMHHIAFELNDLNHIGRACDALAAAGIPLLWGPGRHGPGHNIFTYHRAPDGSIIELFTELDRMTNEDVGHFDPRPWHEDRPQRPKVWEPSPHAANSWGILPPDAFM